MTPKTNPWYRRLTAAALALATLPAFAASIIVDNAEPASSPHAFTTNGAWTTVTGSSGNHGPSYAYATGPSASTAARFRPSITTAGTYRIYVKWVTNSNRADRVPIEIAYEGGAKIETVRRLNQRVNNGVWVFVGTYHLSAGTGNSVLLRASDNGVAVADAVLFDLSDPSTTPPSAPVLTTARAEYSNSDTRLNPVETLIVRTDSGASGIAPAFQIRRAGATFDVKGACGVEAVSEIGAAGGNSVRSYSAASSTITDTLLKQAADAGVTALIGLAMHDPGASGTFYDTPANVAAQYATLTAQIDQWKNYSAVVGWGIGNEIDVASHPNPIPIYTAIEQLARYVRDKDHYHPVTTVHAGSDPTKIARVRNFAPSVDIVSFNSYAHVGNVYGNVIAADWPGPYMVTEYNINQPMEQSGNAGETSWGAKIEPVSNDKALRLLEINQDDLLVHPRCLGGYVFKGAKGAFRVTHTWYPILYDGGADGLKGTPSLDAMRSAWGGPASPSTTAASVLTIKLNGLVASDDITISGSSGNIISTVTVDTPAGATLQYLIEIRPEVPITSGTPSAPLTGVLTTQDSGDPRKFYIRQADIAPGDYRLYYYVRRLGSGSGGYVSVGTASIPFRRL